MNVICFSPTKRGFSVTDWCMWGSLEAIMGDLHTLLHEEYEYEQRENSKPGYNNWHIGTQCSNALLHSIITPQKHEKLPINALSTGSTAQHLHN